MARHRRNAPGDGKKADGLGPHRRCVATGRVCRKDGMLRFVVGPGDEVVPDVGGRLPGRGLWLSAGRDMIDTARSRNLFARAARTRVTVPVDLADRVEGLLVRRCLDLIGLARRAGQVVAGHEKARAWLRADKGGVVLAAADGAAAGKARLRALAPDVPSLELFSGTELGAAMGRPDTVHVVMARGRLSENLLAEAARLKGFRQAPGAQ